MAAKAIAPTAAVKSIHSVSKLRAAAFSLRPQARFPSESRGIPHQLQISVKAAARTRIGVISLSTRISRPMPQRIRRTLR